MKLALYFEAQTFVRDYENYDTIKKAFISLFSFDFRENKVMIAEEVAHGFNEKRIKILTLSLKKESLINKVLKDIFSKMSKADIKTIINSLPTRLDEDYNFFFRLDKAALIDSKLILTDSGDCVHFKVSIAAYPKTLESSIEKMDNYLSAFIKEK